VRANLLADLAAQGLQPLAAELRFDCCQEDLEALAPKASQADCDGVMAIGGGKVLDAGKLLAHRLGLPCITVPTSAATCAGWTALANL
jgi:glycerol dehydrogenase